MYPLETRDWIGAAGAVVVSAGLVVALDTAGALGSPWLALTAGVALLLGFAPSRHLGPVQAAAGALSGALAGAAIWLGTGAAEASALLEATFAAAAGAALLLSPGPRTRRVHRMLAEHQDHCGEGWVVADRFGAVYAANEAAARALFPNLAPGTSVVGRTLPKAMFPALGDPEASVFRLDLGSDRLFELSVGASGAKVGRGLRCATLREVTGQRHQEQRLRRMAHRDSLTGLSNRRHFLQHLETRVAAHPGGHTHHLALLFIDLDSFKSINDDLGHAAGDQCLRALSKRFLSIARGEMSGSPTEEIGEVRAFRLAGDEFALIADGIEDRDAAARLAQAIVECGRDPIEHADQTFSTSLSVGITVCPDDGSDPETLMKRADAAMYAAKRCGKNRFEFYDASFQSGENRARQIESGLREALGAGELVLYYQPKVDAKTHTLVGFEALTRWTSSELGAVGPAEFIPVAERSGLVAELGAWCLREACRQLRVWSDQGFEVVPISVNVSSVQFSQSDLRHVATEALREFALDPQYLELELTESLILRENDETLLCLRDLRSIGLRVSLDDFGSGYSALTYLGRFPLDVLKLDYGFVRDIEHNDAAAGIVGAVVSMAHTLGLGVVAEGVESLEQARLLSQMGCDHLQGFLFSPAVPSEEAEGLLARSGAEATVIEAQAETANVDETHGAVATVEPVARIVPTEPEAPREEVDARILMLDDNAGTLGPTALRLTRLGFEIHYTPAIEEAERFVGDTGNALRLLLASPTCDLEALSALRKTLALEHDRPVPLIVIGDRPSEPQLDEIRRLGVTWVLWAPFADGELGFLLDSALEASSTAGHRAEQRVPVNENAWLRIGKVRHVGLVTSLSIGGCFVEMAEPPEPGTWMRIDFDLPGAPIRAFGEVIYRRSDENRRGSLNRGVGLHFSDLDKEGEEAIVAFVQSVAERYSP